MTAHGLPQSAPPAPSGSNRRLVELAVAALETLGYEVAERENGVRLAQVSLEQSRQASATHPPKFNGQTSFSFVAGETPGNGTEPLSPNSRLWRWILIQLQTRELPLSAAPVGDPQAVHEFSGRLLSQYQVDGGSVHLAGCRLAPVPFVRLVRYDHRSDEHVEVLVPVGDVLAAGQEFSAALITQLHLNEWSLRETPRSVSVRELNAIHREARVAREGLSPKGETVVLTAARPGDENPPLLIAEWCHRASGKFEFEIGDAGLSVHFEDWARNLKPPPITCPVTGEPTYHLAITADGRLIAAEQLDFCCVCRQRLPRTELSTSNVSGKLACDEHTVHCPVTGESLLAEELIECPSTRLAVSPAAVRNGQSMLLTELEPVDAGETTLARLRLDYPVLDRYGTWRLARGAQVDLYVGSKLTGNLLAVVRRDTGALVAAAQKSKWAWNYKPLPLPADHADE